MSQENVEIVSRAVETFNELGYDGFRTSELIADDIEFREPPEQPAPRVARGREEVRRMAEEFDAAWAAHRSEPEEIRALDTERVLMVSRECFTGRDGIELEAPFAAIYTLRDHKIIRWEAFWSRENALEAAGLRE